MAGVNKVILLGNLGKDPEVKTLDGGTKVCNFPLATSETWKDKQGQKQEQTEWHNIVLWRALAEIAEKYLAKGSQIYIEGKLRTRQWTDKDGNKRYTTEIIGDTFTMLGKKQEADGSRSNVSQNNNSNNNFPTSNENDDLPF